MSAAVRQGRVIAGTRELLGWDQKELARAVAERGNVHLADYTLGKIERGERVAKSDELAEIAAVLTVPVGWFFEGPPWFEHATMSPTLRDQMGVYLSQLAA